MTGAGTIGIVAVGKALVGRGMSNVRRVGVDGVADGYDVIAKPAINATGVVAMVSSRSVRIGSSCLLTGG
jgi:hypothetical protein